MLSPHLEDSEVQGTVLCGGGGGDGDVGVLGPVVVDQLLKVHAVPVLGFAPKRRTAVAGVKGREWGHAGAREREGRGGEECKDECM